MSQVKSFAVLLRPPPTPAAPPRPPLTLLYRRPPPLRPPSGCISFLFICRTTADSGLHHRARPAAPRLRSAHIPPPPRHSALPNPSNHWPRCQHRPEGVPHHSVGGTTATVLATHNPQTTAGRPPPLVTSSKAAGHGSPATGFDKLIKIGQVHECQKLSGGILDWLAPSQHVID
jgi:hypothetical protein